MTQINWNRLGPREKQILAILRRADEELTTRDVLREVQADGDNVAYTTVSTVLDRLVEKEVVSRGEERHAGSPRYRYSFEADGYRGDLVDSIVEDVAQVLGDSGLDMLARRATETRTTASDDADPQRNHGSI